MQPAESRLAVVLAAESLLLGDGLELLLARDGQLDVVGRARHADEIRAVVEEHRPDAIVVSILTPVVASLETVTEARALRREFPRLGVVVVSDRGDGYALELMREGSSRVAFLLDEGLPDIATVVSAVRQVCAGQTVLSPEVVDDLVRRRDGLPTDQLTVRELDVLERLAFGASNRTIATSLSLSVKAVEKHVSAIFRKLGLTDHEAIDRRVSAAVLYLRSRADPFA